jgi:hypothetical protein
MKQLELDMIDLIDSDPTASIDDMLNAWRESTGRFDGASTLQMLEAKGLVLIDEEAEVVVLSRRGSKVLERDH